MKPMYSEYILSLALNRDYCRLNEHNMNWAKINNNEMNPVSNFTKMNAPVNFFQT